METRLQRIEHVCRKFQVKALYVFGSRSAEVFQFIRDDTFQTKPSKSDVDIGVLINRVFSIDDKVNLTLELEEIFNVHRVDLVLLSEADAFLAANIIRGERLYVEDSYLADEYELFVLRRAGDLAELERARMTMILGQG